MMSWERRVRELTAIARLSAFADRKAVSGDRWGFMGLLVGLLSGFVIGYVCGSLFG